METKSQLLQLLGVPDRISNNFEAAIFPHVFWDSVKCRIQTFPEEAFISPLPCPPLQFALVNESTPIPANVAAEFLRANPKSLESIWYKISIIAVCQNKYISGDVLQLLLDLGPIEILSSSVRKCLLPHAMRSDNIDVLRVLIINFPSVLSETSELDGEIPLHSCIDRSPEMLSLFIEEGIRQNVGGRNCVGGLYFNNSYDETLFDNLVLALSMAEVLEEGSRSMTWKRIKVCIEYANFVRTGQSIVKANTSDNLLSYSCIGYLPSHLMKEATEEFDLNVSISDILNMISLATDNGEWRRRMKLNSFDLSNMFKTMLAKLRDEHDKNKGIERSPLLEAAQRGLPWDYGLKEIMNSDLTALAKHDEQTGLSPFMVAACGSYNDLEAIFQLLSAYPAELNAGSF
mmetsp:Transcript_5409/g.6920  ORF Transcript_5409/g.6920 Transcript_5409/m.6920 type:complete len:402 (-) Transcript_5409:1522-2727(-)